MTLFVSPFSAPECTDISLAGGKGANLAVLTQAGLAVPSGFCVTTLAYAEFAASIGLAARVEAMLAVLGDEADEVERLTSELRSFIVSAPLPQAIADAVLGSYRGLERDAFVAVRSSGTAEDLAGASFAGLHDTYLDIRGDEAVLDAIKRCWASMWTARATSYRRTRGFDQAAAQIAVVVQQMAEADVAGVMFTANPMTGATNEIVLNSSYGLGEALVSGIATPDEHVLDLDSLQVKERRLGTKQLRIVRNRLTGIGTITEAVDVADQERFALKDQQIEALGALGQQITSLYDRVPQDIEWAIVQDRLFVLQARPVTGVDLSWDEALEDWQTLADDDDTLWTRSWADEVWNGAISPLTYSYRGYMFTKSAEECARLCGITSGIRARVYKYYKGEAYFNTAVQELFVEHTVLPSFRSGMLFHTAPEAKDRLLETRFDLIDYLKLHASLMLNEYGPLKGLLLWEDYATNRIAEANGLSEAELRELSDQGLVAEFEHFVDLKTKFSSDLWTSFFIHAREAVTFLSVMVSNWSDGDSGALLADLFSGLPERTTTAEENITLWRLSERIRGSEALKRAFDANGVDYLAAFDELPEGRSFLDEYRVFLTANAHRGHADRDLYFKRRSEDSSIDYETFRMMLAATSSIDPEKREEQVHERRNAAIAQVEASLQRRSFGDMRVWLFRGLLNYVYQFFLMRDNQRHYFDRYTFSMKRIAVEMGRRLVDRQLLADREDAFFLGRTELYALLQGDVRDPLTHLKIRGRRRNFDLMLEKKANPPLYLRGSKPVAFAVEGADADGSLRGVGTSRGTITARARIVTDLRHIGQIEQGDILVTQSTDPGWTPVFNIITGIVLETGGMLAHGSCLAREYGLPAVQLAGATQSIPDGAVITVNGDTGEILLQVKQESQPELVG